LVKHNTSNNLDRAARETGEEPGCNVLALNLDEQVPNPRAHINLTSLSHRDPNRVVLIPVWLITLLRPTATT
jgi:hypothetical protein